MKKNLFIVMAVCAFLFCACDSLWKVDNGASVSFTINLEELLQDSTIPFEVGVDATQNNIVKNFAVFPGSEPGDDFTGDELTVAVTLHNSENNGVIANQMLSVAQARNTNVVFDRLTVGQNVYAKIEVLFSGDDDDDRDPLFFRARSANTVLVKNENILNARVNAVFVRPDLEESFSGYTPYDTVNTLEKAVEVLGGVGNFMPDATVYVEGTITVTKDDEWNYPGLTITNNSEQTIVELGEIANQIPPEENQIKVAITGVSFKGNPNLETTNGFVDVVNAMLALKDVSMTGHKSPEPGLGALNISPNAQNFVSFDGNVNISENTANGQNSNVAIWLGGSAPSTPIAIMGALPLSVRIHIDPVGLDENSPYPITLVMNEGGTFTKDNFVVSGYETSIREGDGSLMITGKSATSGGGETGTITFYEEDKNGNNLPISANKISLLHGTFAGMGLTSWNNDTLYITSTDVENRGFASTEAYMYYLLPQIPELATSYGYEVSIIPANSTTVEVVFLAQGRIEFYDAVTKQVLDSTSLETIRTSSEFDDFLNETPQKGNLSWASDYYVQVYREVLTTPLPQGGATYSYISDYLSYYVSGIMNNYLPSTLLMTDSEVVGYTLKIYVNTSSSYGTIEFFSGITGDTELVGDTLAQLKLGIQYDEFFNSVKSSYAWDTANPHTLRIYDSIIPLLPPYPPEIAVPEVTDLPGAMVYIEGWVLPYIDCGLNTFESATKYTNTRFLVSNVSPNSFNHIYFYNSDKTPANISSELKTNIEASITDIGAKENFSDAANVDDSNNEISFGSDHQTPYSSASELFIAYQGFIGTAYPGATFESVGNVMFVTLP